MLLCRMVISILHVPPVVVSVVYPLLTAVSFFFHYPRTVGILCLIVYAGKQLLHVVICIVYVQSSRVGFPELIDSVNRPVSGCFIIGRSGRSFPSEASAISNCSFSFLFVTRFGSNQYHTEGGSCTIYCSCRSVFDYGNRFYVVRINAVQIAYRSIDKNQRTGSVDRSGTTHVDAWRTARHTRRSSDVKSGYRTLQHISQ